MKNQLDPFNFDLVEGKFEKPHHSKPTKKFRSNNLFKPGSGKKFEKGKKETIMFVESQVTMLISASLVRWGWKR